MTRVALGVRDESGRDGTGTATLVAVRAAAGSGRPVVVGRWDVDLRTNGLPGRVHHATVGLPAAEAEALVARVETAAAGAAARVLDEVVGELRGEGYGVAGVAVAVDPRAGDLPGRPLPAVLASHALQHMAEAELYREAVVEAAGERGLAVTRHLRGARDADAAEVEVGGRPWRRAHREAAAAALLVLAASVDER